ncbi:hypothetical protein MPDQ_004613 [Monascus purpureus]|uniref:Thioesterase domain-containing protein n=1 Tax=Monascus purpureus TaxID=5098 RepID=A0A507R366_MONPU|nr:hypothetical protein MPDQ_004613 [Monascus purpureus]
MDYKVSAPPVPGSEEDRREIARIHSFYENALPIVRDLRDNPDYVESDAYGNFTEEEKKHMLTSGPLRGSGGLALQKIFWNEKENKAISVVFLGRAIEGWPTVIHGGAIATLIDENLGRVAIRHFPEKTGVTANLEINYRRPMFSEQFYTLHTTIDQENSTERKAYTKTEVRDFTGRICTEAMGLFVVPKTLKLQKLGDQY